MNKNLKLYVTPEDYKVFAGGDWPSYDEYLAGARSNSLDPDVNRRIDEFTKMHLEQGIKFPIDTPTACQSKWTWSTVYLNQLSTASCHRVKPIKFSLEEFDNFHNIPKKLEDRRLMLKGEWPQGGCEYCKHIEDAGGHSDRQHNLNIRGLTPPELETNLTAVEVSPRIVEIFAQNTCNLQCVYCNDSLSSKIQHENLKFGAFNKDGVTIPITPAANEVTKEYFERFIQWLDKNVTSLARLHLLGGETFIQHELMTRVLDILEKNPNPNLEFCIFSNMNVPDKYWTLYINRIKDLQKNKHIKRFDLTASIDCWGPEQEYVRSGLNLQKFEERLAWASEQGNWLWLNVNQTVTAMTIKTMPDLIKKINQYNKNRHIGHYFQFYTGLHMFQHPEIFSYDMWADDFDRIFKEMKTSNGDHEEAVLRMTGLQKQLQQVKHNNYDAIEKLHIYLDELDRRRGTNWRTLFPYLIV